MSTRLVVPKNIKEWTDLLISRGDASPRSFLYVALIKLCQLRHDVAKDTPKLDRADVRAAALSIEAELAMWEHNLPDEWRYNIHYGLEDSEHVFNGIYHTTIDYSSTNTWNQYRYGRILTHQIILNHLPTDVTSPPSAIVAFSRQVVYQMSLDIAASVPFLLGLIKPSENLLPDLRIDGGVFLLYPLAVAAGTASMLDKKLFNWICGRLRYIGEVLGVFQGIAVEKRMHDLYHQ
jgi:hypothetical protein